VHGRSLEGNCGRSQPRHLFAPGKHNPQVFFNFHSKRAAVLQPVKPETERGGPRKSLRPRGVLLDHFADGSRTRRRGADRAPADLATHLNILYPSGRFALGADYRSPLPWTGVARFMSKFRASAYPLAAEEISTHAKTFAPGNNLRSCSAPPMVAHSL